MNRSNGTKAVFLAISTAFVLKLFFFDFIIAQGHSMEPAIKNGTVLIISRLTYGIRLPWRQEYLLRWARPKPGEVVIFYTPMGELAVKRCTELTDGDSFFAVGDNDLASYDSRAYGYVSINNIIGKVLGY
ncbi:MAG: S26 family signal peptidase [Treponema sp.]|jgi:signal peptidase I|nr:S26 family signal peptidase [Treponema sp.]